jgi:hypothetical protein
MEARLSWIREVVREQEGRLSGGKERKHRFSADGAIGNSKPPPIRMVADFARDANAQKRAAAAENTIAKAMAISDNKYMARYKDSIKGIQTVIELEADVGKQVRQNESDKNARMESASILAREKEGGIAKSLEAARTTTNSTAKGKALADVRRIHAERRAALRELAYEGSRRATDVLVEAASEGGGGCALETIGFHDNDDVFCFFC